MLPLAIQTNVALAKIQEAKVDIFTHAPRANGATDCLSLTYKVERRSANTGSPKKLMFPKFNYVISIDNHLLTDTTQFPLNHGTNRFITPRYLVLHYDAGASLTNTIAYLKNRQLSYHLLIDRDGTITQGVPFNKRAWHAGRSNFRGIPADLNSHSIGISMGNRGIVHKHGNRFWLEDSRGRKVGSPLNPNQVARAPHPSDGRLRYWERYPKAQVATCHALCKLLIQTYPTITDIIGHDEIAIGRKIDPGPAFPRENFYGLVPDRGRADRNVFTVTTPGDTLNVRATPSASATIDGVLQDGQQIYGRSLTYRRSVPTEWLSISLDERYLHNGYVSARFLKRVS